ncbi:MAG: FHA domain-containing protein [Chloroflexota bacterium]|nr:FHA domain-containing protein [Chloroflexota bacterium]
MSLNVLLLVLRIAFLLLLYVFLLAVVKAAWSGVRATAAMREAIVPPASRVRLRVLQAGKQDADGQTFDLWSSATLGRAPDNTVVLPDGTVSAHHAAIRHENGQWWLEDLRSTNGTSVNEQWLTQPAVLFPGDVIRLGDVSVRLEVDEPVHA